MINENRQILHKELAEQAYKVYSEEKLKAPKICSKCGRSDLGIDGHHWDYSKPLEVEWLCDKCHKSLHIKLRWTLATFEERQKNGRKIVKTKGHEGLRIAAIKAAATKREMKFLDLEYVFLTKGEQL